MKVDPAKAGRDVSKSGFETLFLTVAGGLTQMALRPVGNRRRAASVSNALANGRWPLVRRQVHPDDDPKGPEE